MLGLVASIENSGFAVWVRESESLLAYPLVISLHTIGLAFLVGTSVMICLRVLGVARGLPLPPMKALLPIMWAGFWVNAFSGVVLLIAAATAMLTNPLFYLKMLALLSAAVSMRVLEREAIFREAVGATAAPVTVKAESLAGSILVLWTGAIAAGRWTAYLYIGN